MDSVFGIGAPELIVILLLAGIVMGPHRIHQVARWLGRVTAQFQAIARGFARQLSAELDAVDQGGEIKGAMHDVQDLQRQITELRRELASVSRGTVQESKKVMRENQQLVEETIKSPMREASEALEQTPSPQDDGNSASSSASEASDGESAKPSKLPEPIEVPDDPAR